MHYPAVIHKDENSDYGVCIPDIPGCFSAGSSYEEALINAHEAIECHLEGLLLDGQSIPTASELDVYLKKTEYKNGIWALIEVDLSQVSGKTRRVNITLPERILTLIDLYTKNHAMKNRSSLIADATLSYLSKLNLVDRRSNRTNL